MSLVIQTLMMLLRAAIYLALFWGLQKALSGLVSPWLAVFLIVVFILYVENQIAPRLYRKVIGQLFRPWSQFQRMLEQLNQDLNRLLEFDPLLERIRRFLIEAFPPGEAFFYLNTDTAFEWLELEGLPEPPPLILELSLSESRCTLFQRPVEIYTVEDLFYTHPECHQLLFPLQQRYADWRFIPIKGLRRASGFLLLHPRTVRMLELPEARKSFLGVLNKLADILENARIHSEIKRRSLESALLLRMVKKITATLNLQEVLENIIDAVSQLVRYDAAAIFLVDREKKVLRHMVTRGYDRALLDQVPLKLHQGISGWVVETREPVIIPDVSKDPHYFPLRPQTRSQITVPIFKGEEAIGALVLESDQYNYFTFSDLELLTSFASLAAIAISNAQLYEDSLKKRQLESDLLVASSVQRALLPQRPPHFPGVVIHTENIPSRYVGGDLFDIVRVDPQRLALAIGDVSGKGAPGAILMAMLFAGFRSLIREIYQVAEIVARLNNFLVQTTMEGYFASFFLAFYNHATREFTYCNAGQNPPILLDRHKKAHFLEEGGTVLGFLPDMEYRQQTLQLEGGEYLLMYTDGVVEIRNPRGEEYGEKRLLRVLKRHYGAHPREIKNAILRSIQRFGKSREFQDDLTMVIVRFLEGEVHA